jgi:Skp family chaperone for outer membrane proteins
MKGKILRVVPIVLSLFLFGGTGWAQTRIATVNLRKIFDSYWKTKQADAALKEREAELDKDMKEMVADYNKAKDEYQTLLADADNQVISPAERDKRKHAAEDKLKQLKDLEDHVAQYRRSAGVQIEEQAKRMKENILTEIRNVVSAKAKTASFALVIDTTAETASGTPLVLYTNNENDVTDSVLQQLNSSAPVELPKATEDTTSEPKDGKQKDGKK